QTRRRYFIIGRAQPRAFLEGKPLQPPTHQPLRMGVVSREVGLRLVFGVGKSQRAAAPQECSNYLIGESSGPRLLRLDETDPLIACGFGRDAHENLDLVRREPEGVAHPGRERGPRSFGEGLQNIIKASSPTENA